MFQSAAAQNSFTDRFKRSWDVTKQTFNVMMHDKEILLFPILAAIFSLITFAIFIFPFLATALVAQAVDANAAPFMFYLGIFAFYFIVSFSTIFFNAGVVHIAKTRMEGGNATFMDGIKTAWSHVGKLAQWALIAATVGILLNMLESQARKKGGILGMLGVLATRVLGLAWAIVSLFVVPSIVLKNHGPIDALKSSAQTIKKTWGESLIKWFGLSVVSNMIIFALSLFLLLPGILALFASPAFGIIMISIYALSVSLVMVFFSAANTVYDTALFIYADTGKEPKFFSKEQVHDAFVQK